AGFDSYIFFTDVNGDDLLDDGDTVLQNDGTNSYSAVQNNGDVINVKVGQGDCIGYAEAAADVDANPLMPEFDLVQGDCIGGSGGITFKNFDPEVNLQYSLDGAAFIIYDGTITLPVGPHTIAVRIGDEGCVSDDLDVEIITPLPNDPFTLNPEITQPDCETLVGTIKIRVGDNTGIDTGFFDYVVTDGGTTYYDGVKQPANGFEGLPPGNYVITGSTSDGCNSGRVEVTLENPICDNFEGCTLGYWKNHTDRWTCYSTCTLYGSVFTNAPSQLSGLTLLEVLNLGGGGINNLGRQSVAALLNTCHGDVNFEILSTEELIAYVNTNFNKAGAAGSYLDNLNNAGCTLGGSSATTAPSSTCPSTVDTIPGKGKPGKNNKAAFTASFSAYPVPFRETLNIKYEFDYKSDVSIQFFDMQGRLLSTYKAKKVTKGDVTNLNLDFATRASQVYIVKVTTDKDVFTKNIISDK
ncbi:T9SS type A sorting domain-containing protein, partial [Gillisia sp. CAL575]|uniref:T9SS type A sorting domain-containing protein n=1 Tax=Gillisia sp. CAL575 TaxID=985255 RepID=UPI00054D86B9